MIHGFFGCRTTCGRQRHVALLLSVLLMANVMWIGRVYAVEGFAVHSVQPAWNGNVYQLNARVQTPLTEPAVEALHRGVALTLTFDIEVNRKRRLWLDETVATLEQQYQVRYHALTDHYLLVNLNTGVQSSFPHLQATLDVVGLVVDLPVLDRQFLEPRGEYQARMRVRLDLESLPPPLRLIAYFTPSWWMTSEWHLWKVKV